MTVSIAWNAVISYSQVATSDIRDVRKVFGFSLH